MNIAKITDLTYLPTINDFGDDLNIEELNKVANFCKKNKFRSFCTYTSFVPYLEMHLPKITCVIDFPKGLKSPAKKLMDIGIAFETCKSKASSSEIDIVLNREEPIVELLNYEEAIVQDLMPYKLIIDLYERDQQDIVDIIKTLKIYSGPSYIKTSTGRESRDISFTERLSKVKWLKETMGKEGLHLPIKVSGKVSCTQQMLLYKEAAGEDTIFGISYNSIKEFPEFKGLDE